MRKNSLVISLRHTADTLKILISFQQTRCVRRTVLQVGAVRKILERERVLLVRKKIMKK